MNCLVTGAAGFIGNALVRRLASNGQNVRALIHTQKPLTTIPSVTYIIGDIADKESLPSLIKDVDIVYHCAALVKDYGTKEPFIKVNVEATRHLAEACRGQVKRFIYLGHHPYESVKNIGYYSLSKSQAEHYLLDQYLQQQFPVVIIRPGNVYGPGATTWVLRPLKAIQQKRIALINHGQGIFLHTYIDNLIDAMISAMDAPHIEGEMIDITDGDNTTTWGQYLNTLAEIAKKKPITKHMSTTTALFISRIMMLTNRVFGVEPWVTPTAVSIFSNTRTISIKKAERLLHYKPTVDYAEGMKNVRQWLEKEHYV